MVGIDLNTYQELKEATVSGWLSIVQVGIDLNTYQELKGPFLAVPHLIFLVGIDLNTYQGLKGLRFNRKPTRSPSRNRPEYLSGIESRDNEADINNTASELT